MSDIIFKKISLLKGYIENLENFLLKCRDGVADESVFLSIERLFQLIVDEAVDINAIILEKEGKPFPDTNQATFEALVDIGAIPKEFHLKIAGSVGLRNRLVHRYETVQRKVLIEEVARYVMAYKEYAIFVVKRYV